MVVTFFVPSADIARPQDRTATPSTWTVHAPHCCSPQPNFVPVKPIASRITQSNGVSGLASTSYCFPLTVRELIGLLPMRKIYRNWIENERWSMVGGHWSVCNGQCNISHRTLTDDHRPSTIFH